MRVRSGVSLRDESMPDDPLRDLAASLATALALDLAAPAELDTRHSIEHVQRVAGGTRTLTRRHPTPCPYAGGTRTEVEVRWVGDDGRGCDARLVEDVWGGWGGELFAEGDAPWCEAVRAAWERWCEGKAKRAV